MGARCPWSQARRWGRTCRQRPGDHVYGTFSCGSTGVDSGACRCSPERRGDCRHAQLGIQDHPPISGFPVRGCGLRGRACTACWTVCVPIRIPVRQGIDWDGPIDPLPRGVRGTRGGGPGPPATHCPPHPLEIGQGGTIVGATALFQSPALAFLYQSARTREQRTAVGLGCLSYTLWLRVSEAATIAPRDLRGTNMASFIATKVGGPSEEKCPLGR